MSYDAAGYLEKYLNPKRRKALFSKALKTLKPLVKTFDTIAFTGVSGALTAPVIANLLGKHLVVVRKRKGEAHSGRKVEGYADCSKYIIVDDFIDTGATVKRIKRTIKDRFSSEACCVGVLTMSDGRFHPEI